MSDRDGAGEPDDGAGEPDVGAGPAPRDPGGRWNPVRAVFDAVAAGLARLGLVDGYRARRASALAWPRAVTGFARMSQSAADVAMVGTAVGSAAIAGIGFATPFWYLAITFGGGIAGGTISQVSQRYGAGAESIDVVVVQAAWLTLLVMVPFAAAFWFVPERLVGLMTGAAAPLDHGATYLRYVGPAAVFGSLNLIGSRALVGADDARSPMVLRAGGAVLNIGVNAVLIFGLGMGVVGAAVGTAVSNGLVTVAFAWGLLGGWLPVVGRFPVTVDLGPPYADWPLLGDLVEISTPLVARGIAGRAAQFPLLAMVASFGTPVVAAFVVSRRVRGLLGVPGWGFGLAASSLSGQSLGRGEEAEAAAYGRDIVTFSVVVHLLLAVAVFAAARPVARAFVSEPAVLGHAVVFVRLAAVSVLGRAVSGAAAGPLRASGDTRWPLYATVLGQYGVTLPVVYLGATTSVGVLALYVAVLTETAVPAIVNGHRFRSGAWLTVSRQYRPAPGD